MNSVRCLLMGAVLFGSLPLLSGCGGSSEADLTQELSGPTPEQIEAQKAYEEEYANRDPKDR